MEWLSLASTVVVRTESAISPVVRTDPTPLPRRSARECVNHWCCSSATNTEPSENSTS